MICSYVTKHTQAKSKATQLVTREISINLRLIGKFFKLSISSSDLLRSADGLR